jgi:hypothetical protein
VFCDERRALPLRPNRKLSIKFFAHFTRTLDLSRGAIYFPTLDRAASPKQEASPAFPPIAPGSSVSGALTARYSPTPTPTAPDPVPPIQRPPDRDRVNCGAIEVASIAHFPPREESPTAGRPSVGLCPSARTPTVQRGL